MEPPITGWHYTCLLRNIDDRLWNGSRRWKNQVGFPTGEILEKLPKTAEQDILVRQNEFQYAIDNDLVCSPGLHSWSIYRFDKDLRCLRFLLQMARDNDVSIQNSKDYYLGRRRDHSKQDL